MHHAWLIGAVGILPSIASAHMRMLEPYPINSPDDPEVPDNLKDYEYTSPLDASGSDFPCKGFHEEETSHVSKATYQAGGSGKLSIQANSATHGGGSCQISLSYDNGATWKVIKSMIGGCPITLDYDFTVPADAPSSDDALLAWSWFNLIGNREMYMNCARVTIEGSAPGRHRRSQIARREGELSSLPDMFTCNIGQGCTTTEGENVEFEDPGEDVVRGENSMETQAAAGTGDSGAWNGSDGSDGSTGDSGSGPDETETDSADDSDSGSGSSADGAASGEASTAADTETGSASSSDPSSDSTSTPATDATTTSEGGSCADGTIICDSPSTWSVCVHGAPMSMGSVADGTTCEGGKIN